jgi:quinohemoprotein ethanol dehydrogenase
MEGKESARSGNLRNVSRVLAFKVGSNTTLPPLPSDEKVAAQPPASTADPATIARGNQLFGQYCSVCHGEAAVGGGVVPDLRASSFLSNDFWYEIVLNGAMKDAGMAPFKSVLDHHDAEAIRAYIIQRANQDRAEASKGDTTAVRSR